MKAMIFSYHLDEAAILKVVVQQAGFESNITRDVDQLIEKWVENPVDFFLLAFGTDSPITPPFIERLRSQSLVPILLVTDRLPEDTQVSYLEAGADLLIERPFNSRS